MLQGRTAIVIAHRLAAVERADELVILDGGRIIAQGTRAELANDPHSRCAALLRMDRAASPDRSQTAEGDRG